jgi:hypothetical protein
METTTQPTLKSLYELLLDMNRRLIRTETRVVKLMAQSNLDSDGYPYAPIPKKEMYP